MDDQLKKKIHSIVMDVGFPYGTRMEMETATDKLVSLLDNVLKTQTEKLDKENQALAGVGAYARHTIPCLQQMQQSYYCNCGLKQVKQKLKQVLEQS